MNILETFGLGVRYGQTWALRDCTLAIPEGRIVALVGSNGAGKTTLLQCTVGLTVPTRGVIRVLGGAEAASPAALDRIAFVAQDAPLYSQLTVNEMLQVAANLNRRFDGALARNRLESLTISLRHRVGKLSPGQRAQLALTLALARHPELLVFDEPLARLDPVARHDVMAHVMGIAAEEGISVIFSSHVIAELERVAEYLILLAEGKLQLVGPIDDLLASHAIMSGPADETDPITERFYVVRSERAARRVQLLVRHDEPVEVPIGWEMDMPSLEELVLGYLRDPSVSGYAGPLGIAVAGAKGSVR